jgi:hypothetical protein
MEQRKWEPIKARSQVFYFEKWRRKDSGLAVLTVTTPGEGHNSNGPCQPCGRAAKSNKDRQSAIAE